MGRIFLIAIVVVPMAEIAVFILLGQAIGLVPTLLGVVLSAVLGALIVRHQGLSLISRMGRTMSRGELPSRAIADAMLVGLAGLLLVVPGYVSDAVALALLLRPVRTLVYRALSRRFTVLTPARTIELDPTDFR